MENLLTFEIQHNIPIPSLPARREGPYRSCHCGGFPREGYKTCDKCLRSTKTARLKRVSEGVCEYFGCPHTAKQGHTSCDEHLKRMLAYSLVWREKRVKAKLCIDCGKRPQWWTLRCVICRADYSDSLPYGAMRALKTYRRLEQIDARRQQAETVVSFLEDERMRRILTLRHGLADGVDRTLEEIGAEFKITRERIRQIEGRALRDMAEAGLDVSLLRPPFGATQRPRIKTVVPSDEERKKARAHALVGAAIKDGRIIKQPCEKCGDAKSIAHHHNYDKPLEVEWLCRSHHMEAHGRGKGSKRTDKVPAPSGPRDAWWLRRIEPDNTHYDATAIVNKLRAHKVKQMTVCKATGLYSSAINLIVRGRKVKDSQLLAVLRYVESLPPRPALKINP